MAPPSDSQPPQPPLYHRCHSALSCPRTNTSSRSELHEDTPGPEVRTPPSDSHVLSALFIVLGLACPCAAAVDEMMTRPDPCPLKATRSLWVPCAAWVVLVLR